MLFQTTNSGFNGSVLPFLSNDSHYKIVILLKNFYYLFRIAIKLYKYNLIFLKKEFSHAHGKCTNPF